MYQAYFGFSEQPFSIAPDPKFLFLGQRHQEALDHLRHGLLGSGGFILLTGEVGTGKTTLSRAIIKELADELQLVFVLNPKLSETELLATIAQGFGIPEVNEQTSLKELTDKLQAYLLQAASRDKRPVVLIDEAQHLYPAALEQLRLLTNLETDSQKLLSVLLIGQPELKTLLERQELRQVAQRIVARYQLLPFTKKETEHYISHRLLCAHGSEDTFTAQATQLIWRYTQGTPRLINLLCDRALQITFQSNQNFVVPKTIEAAREALPSIINWAGQVVPSTTKPPTFLNRVKNAFAIFGALIFFIALVWWVGKLLKTETVNSPEITSTVEAPIELVGLSFEAALQQLLQPWQLGNLGLGQAPCERLQRYQLLCVRAQLSLNQIAQQNIPVVILTQDQSYLLVQGVQTASRQGEEQGQVVHWLVEDASGLVELSQKKLESLYVGDAFYFIPYPKKMEEPTSEAWHAWVESRLSAAAPYSLQEADLDLKKNWLLDKSVGVSEDDGWLLSVLTVAEDYRGPQLIPGPFNAYRMDRAELNSHTLPAQVRYPRSNNDLQSLSIPKFEFIWPIEAAQIATQTATDSMLGSEISEVAREQASSDEESLKSKGALNALDLLFEEAVRAVPPVTTQVSPANEHQDLSRFQAKATQESNTTLEEEASSGVVQLAELSAIQRESLPKLAYEQHVYSSRAQQRWILLGGERLHEGEQREGLRLISIQPNYSIFALGDLLFQVEALEDLD